ncbi:MAG: hypothetical protein AAFV37_09230 [Pseudomonadota bacterium]
MNFTQARGLAPRIGLALALCLGFGGAAHAANDQTEAGATVSNTFTLNYEVSSVAQPVITNDPSISGAVLQGTPTAFTVDRRIDLTLTATNSPLTTTPGATGTLSFELLNDGNDNAAYAFSIRDLDTGSGTFDATSQTISYMVDANDDGTANDGSFATIAETATGAGAGSATVTGDVPKGIRVFLQVSGTVPPDAEDNDQDQITLVAEVRDPTAFLNEASATPAAVTTASAGANVLEGTAQNVLADGTGVATEESDRDGLFAANGVFDVESPDLEAEKVVLVVAEPDLSGSVANCDTATVVADAKAVPGACVQYTITVENTGDSAAASNLVINDILPAEVTFVSASQTGFVDDATDPATGPSLAVPANAADSDCDGSTTCQIELSDAQLDAGVTGQIVIRAEIK